MIGQPVDKDVADYFLLKAVADLSEEEDYVDAAHLFGQFRQSFHAGKEWSTPKVGKRLWILEEHGFVTVKTPGNNRGMLTHEDGPIGMVKITSAGEQALKLPPGRFKSGGAASSVTDRSVNFHAPVQAGNLATGDYSQQTANLTLTLGDLLKAVGQAIEENPEIPEEQKEEAQTLVDKLKENLPHAAQITTLSTAAIAAITTGLGWLG